MNTTHTGLVRHLRTLVARQAIGGLPDQQLLETFVTERSEASFAALVQRHGPMVLSVRRRVLHHVQDAEDAFQAVFLVFARKAGSIRKQESVGSWLHGVAYRVAQTQKAKTARRAAHERQWQGRPPADPVEDITWRELRAVLDEELRKLPEKYRSPLVLCYLEGKTRDEAARQLGWTRAVFRRRLEQGRDRLGALLRRRGLTLSAALSAPLLVESTAEALVPPLLAETAVRAGLALASGQTVNGLVSGSVTALAEGAVPTLFAGKLKLIAGLVLMTSLAAGLVAQQMIAATNTPLAAEPPPAAAPKSPASSPRPAGPSSAPAQAVAVRGRVLGPDGQPIAGAKVYVSTYTYKDKTDPKVRAETDADGRFRLTASRAEADRGEMIAAVAPGYGPDWVSMKEADNGKELTLRLVKDDVPIKGRVLDLEGRPIAGVTVRVERVRKMPGEDLTPWLKALQAKPKDRNAVAEVQMRYERIMTSVWGIIRSSKSVKTGADGRFELRGFGRERVMQLRIKGPGIEYRTLTVMTRPGLKDMPPDLHGAAFDHLAAPSKPIRGTVRDKSTGKPLAGIRVSCYPGNVDAITDKDGHYEIPGIPKSEQYSLNAGYRAVPYIVHYKNAGDTPGLDPITVNFEMERGLLVRVRVREKGTGKPVGGVIQYAVRADNPNLKNFTIPQNVVSWDGIEWDGSYNLAALPGPAYIAIRAHEDRFTRARVQGQKEDALFLHDVASLPLHLVQFHAVVPINPSADDPKSLVCDIDLDPGRSVSGVVVGPDDHPLTGVSAAGLGSLYSLPGETAPLDNLDNRFSVCGLEPGRPRTVVFWHEEQRLARAIVVRGDEKTPLKVRLEPRGALIGRLVDAMGRPRPGIEVLPQLSGKPGAPLPPSLTLLGDGSLRDAVLPVRAFTDADGRFQIKGLVPGLHYDLVFAQRNKVFGQVKAVAGKPGATVDMGEIKTKAPSEKDTRNEGP